MAKEFGTLSDGRPYVEDTVTLQRIVWASWDDMKKDRVPIEGGEDFSSGDGPRFVMLIREDAKTAKQDPDDPAVLEAMAVVRTTKEAEALLVDEEVNP